MTEQVSPPSASEPSSSQHYPPLEPRLDAALRDVQENCDKMGRLVEEQSQEMGRLVERALTSWEASDAAVVKKLDEVAKTAAQLKADMEADRAEEAAWAAEEEAEEAEEEALWQCVRKYIDAALAASSKALDTGMQLTDEEKLDMRKAVEGGREAMRAISEWRSYRYSQPAPGTAQNPPGLNPVGA